MVEIPGDGNSTHYRKVIHAEGTGSGDSLSLTCYVSDVWDSNEWRQFGQWHGVCRLHRRHGLYEPA